MDRVLVYTVVTAGLTVTGAIGQTASLHLTDSTINRVDLTVRGSLTCTRCNVTN
jgi:hypothetical protein